MDLGHLGFCFLLRMDLYRDCHYRDHMDLGRLGFYFHLRMGRGNYFHLEHLAHLERLEQLVYWGCLDTNVRRCLVLEDLVALAANFRRHSMEEVVQTADVWQYCVAFHLNLVLKRMFLITQI